MSKYLSLAISKRRRNIWQEDVVNHYRKGEFLDGRREKDCY